MNCGASSMKQYKHPSAGDNGTSRLLDGTTAGKDVEIFEAIGDVDQLSSLLGWCAVLDDQQLKQQIMQIQQQLYRIGAQLAGCQRSELDSQATDDLERQIKDLWGQLPGLKGFVGPAGCELACRLYIARAVCRQAERAIVRASHGRTVRQGVLQYINRLSDWLFVQAREANFHAGVEERCWKNDDQCQQLPVCPPDLPNV